MNFFQARGGIMSLSDRHKMKQREEEKLIEEMENDNELSWGQVRKENLKDVLLNEFISDICRKMNFNVEEKKELTTTINKGIMLKCFNSNNIFMENGKIVEIDGLIYNEDTNEYEIDDVYLTRKNTRKDSGLGIEKYDKETEYDFLDIWRKYLENLENKRNKRVTSFSVTQNEDSKTYGESRTYESNYDMTYEN